MLKQRIVTALVLVLLLLGILLYTPPLGFGTATLFLIAAAAWEWARLNGWPRTAWVFAVLCAILCVWVGLLCLPSQSWLHRVSPWSAFVLLWLLVFVVMLLGKGAWWLRVPSFFRLCFGFIVLIATWWAVFEMRSHSINFLLSAMALIWLADIGGYFAGRFLGGRFFVRKLAPSLSPKKTWEGVLGGFVAMLLLSAVWMQLEHALAWQPSVMRLLVLKYGWLGFTLCCGVILCFAVLGDLFESMMKRCAEVKDSSRLLPGHGGVLDRVDALLPTMPLILCLL